MNERKHFRCNGAQYPYPTEGNLLPEMKDGK